MLINIGGGFIRMTAKILALASGLYRSNGTDAHKLNAAGDRLVIKYKN